MQQTVVSDVVVVAVVFVAVALELQGAVPVQKQIYRPLRKNFMS
jgi:hypothetical protein